MPAPVLPRIAVFVSSERIEAAQIDVRPTDWLAWVVLAVPADDASRSSRRLPVGYLFDGHDLSIPRPDDPSERFHSVEGFVASVELVPAHADDAETAATVPAGSTSEALDPRFRGAIVTFAGNVDAYVIALDLGEAERGTRLLGTRATPTSIIMVSWQLREDGFDVRPGDRLSWRVSTRDPSRWWSPLGVDRSIDLLADTYLHGEGGGAAVEMDHGSVLPAREAPVFLRVDGIVQTVEELVGSAPDATLREVQTTRGAYDERVGAYVVTLQPGAVFTASPHHDDERYETRR